VPKLADPELGVDARAGRACALPRTHVGGDGSDGLPAAVVPVEGGHRHALHCRGPLWAGMARQRAGGGEDGGGRGR
jgi:hypothetical protein